jgi:two-component system nitrogen regulation sensor histidine kinase NtrY
MTSQLENQRGSLETANRQLDERRRFTETVLSGVSAGVIGLDAAGNINLPNRSASELLVTDLGQRIGENLADTVPEMAGLLKEVMDRPERLRQSEIKLLRQRHMRNLLVRIAAERLSGEIVGYVVTFDDITELLSAQRKAAWSDIARRIAHEIKNPLTPIQLSAERLKRKYMKEIKTEPEVFSTCTDTIVRQVQDIGRMVDEFSSFARMPQATLKPENLVEICRQTVFLERNRHPDISFEVDLPDAPLRVNCDSRQIGQAVTNILKNAAESITGRCAASSGDPAGHIRFSLGKESTPVGENILVVVEDDGLGLPKEHRDRLIEPYVTTREKGTGLGLAMVKKIMEDHSGDLVLEDREEGGARVSLVFMQADEPASRGNDDAEDRESDPMKVATEILAHGS